MELKRRTHSSRKDHLQGIPSRCHPWGEIVGGDEVEGCLAGLVGEHLLVKDGAVFCFVETDLVDVYPALVEEVSLFVTHTFHLTDACVSACVHECMCVVCVCVCVCACGVWVCVCVCVWCVECVVCGVCVIHKDKGHWKVGHIC